MNTRKTVYNKLFTEKVELAKHEVELAIIDDINQLIKVYESKVIPDYIKIEKERNDLWLKNRKLKEESKIAYDLYNKSWTQRKSLIEKYTALANQLGIDVKNSKEIQKLYQVSEGQADVGRAYKTYENIAEYFKQF